ncbi:MAG: GAF domain-containing protein [Anaerolineae bacterium]|nr:GAF domain-containing protein [Anaerolineae bacterium]
MTNQNSLFETIYDVLDEEVWIMERRPDGEFVVSHSNLTSFRNTGLQTHEVIGQTIRRVLGDSKADQLYAVYEKCLQTGEVMVYQESLDFGPNRHWYLTKIVPLPDKDGRQRVADVSLDITHRMESDALLHAISQAQLQFIKGASPNDLFAGLLKDMIELTRSEYGFIAEVLMDEAENRPYMRMFAINDRAWSPEMHALYNQAAGGMKFANMSTLFGAPIVSGQVIIANDPIHDPRHGGFPRGHPNIRAFLGVPFVHNGMVLGLIGLANRPGGYSAAWADFLQPLGTACVHLILGYHTQEQRHIAESKLRLLNDDLEHRVANRTIELEVANTQLREHDREKSKFVAVVAHELRQPIAVLKMELYLLQHGRAADQPKHMDKMARQMEILNELVENILDLSRLDLSQPITFSAFNLNEVVSNVAEAYRNLAHDAGLDFQVDLASDLPMMFGVANQMAQVVTNLVVNAVRYTPNGFVRIQTRPLLDDERIQFSVADTGMGIDPADLPRLYERFFRGKQHGPNAHIPGNGLGLAIVKEIVDLHQGTIEAQSTVGGGTTFTLTFPILREEPINPV